MIGSIAMAPSVEMNLIELGNRQFQPGVNVNGEHDLEAGNDEWRFNINLEVNNYQPSTTQLLLH